MKVARHILRFERQRSPDLRIPTVEHAASREHADHGVRDSVEQDGAADHVRIRPKLRPPQCMAENRYALLSGLVIALYKRTAERCFHAENIEIMRRDSGTAQLDRFANPGERHSAAGPRGNIFENSVLFLPVEVV